VQKRAKRVTALVLIVAVVGYFVSWIGSGGPSGLRRATRDRADDFHGPQIHFVYAVPRGPASLDIHRDVDGTLSESIVLLVSWFHQQIGAPYLAVDTYKRRPDITFVRLPRTNGAYERLGPYAVAGDVSSLLPPRRHKIYAIYYQGTLPAGKREVCGVARGGLFAIAYIGQACFSTDDFLSADIGGYNTLVFVAAHEIVHELGFVPNCAPHSTRTGHVDDNDLDLMAPVLGDNVPVLDVNNDDYYRAHVHGCPDLSRSPYLHGPPSLGSIRR